MLRFILAQGDASISVSISMVDSPRFDTPRALDDGTSISDVLPEEVLQSPELLLSDLFFIGHLSYFLISKRAGPRACEPCELRLVSHPQG